MRSADRGLAPVVGGALLIAVAVLLAAVTAGMLLNVGDSSDPSPDVVFDLQPTDDRARYVLVHDGGSRLDGDEIRLRGATDPTVMAGTTVSAGDRVSFHPTTEEVTVVWHDDDHGTSFVIWTAAAETTVPEPDVTCDWVETETAGGTEDAKIDGTVVDCDVETEKVVDVEDGTVVGEVDSDRRDFDGDNATVYGPVDVENVLNLQVGLITGDATSRTADVKLDEATVDGSVTAAKVADINGSTVEGSVTATNAVNIHTDSRVVGDVESETQEAKIYDTTVEGSVTAADQVELDGATVEGHVYVDDADFDCTDSTIDGEDCGEYSPRDPDDW